MPFDFKKFIESTQLKKIQLQSPANDSENTLSNSSPFIRKDSQNTL